MSESEVRVTIVGDASGVQPAIALTNEEIASLGPTLAALTAGFAELTAAMTAGLAETNASLAEMAESLKRVQTETAEEAGLLQGMALSAREGMEAMVSMRESIVGFGELLMAAFAVEGITHFAESIANAAEKTSHLAQQFGLSVGQVQALGAATAAVGIPLDSLTKAMGILDRNVATKPKLFSDLGIEIPKNASQMQVLNAVMDKFATTADGPNKAALALMLMGRSGKELIPFLNQGADGLAELTRKAEEYGAINEDAAAKGLVLADSVNEGKIAMMGLKTTLSDAFAPLLTSIIDGFNEMVKTMTKSYEEGGAVKITFDAITESLRALGQMLGSVGTGFGVLFGGTSQASDDWGATIKSVINSITLGFNQLVVDVVTVATGIKLGFEVIITAAYQWWGNLKETFANVSLNLTVLGMDMQTFSKVAEDAFTLHWGSIAADWDAGMAAIDGVVRKRGAQIVADARSTAAQAAQALASINQQSADLEKYFNTGGLGGGVGAAAGAFGKPEPKPRVGGGDVGDLEHAGKKGKGAPKAKDDLVQHLEEELTAKKNAWAMEQDAEGTAIAYSLQAESDYWKQILTRTDLSAKDRAAIEQKYLSAHSQLVRERISIEIDGYKAQIEAAGNNASQKQEIAEKELAFIGKTYGLESKEYAQAQAEIVRIKRAAAQQLAQIEEQIARAHDKAGLDEIAEAEKVAQWRVSMGLATAGQLIAQQRQFENQRFAIIEAAAERDMAAAKKANDPLRFNQAYLAEEQARKLHQAKLTEIDRQAVAQRTAMERQAINATANLWGQNLAKMITLQQSFASTIHNLYVGMVGIVSDALAQIIEKWLVQHLTALLIGGAHSKIAAVGEVTNNAAVAGSAAWASTAAIPIIGPELAPAAAATAYAGALGFLGSLVVPSGAGGIWDVDGGLAMIHENEMVLPAWAAQPLRSMLTSDGSGAANNNAPSPANDGGGFHYHDHTERGLTPGQIMNNRAALAKAVKMAHREGRFAGVPA